MVEQKIATASDAGVQPGAGAPQVAENHQAVTDQTVQLAYEALIADLAADNFDMPELAQEGAVSQQEQLIFAPELGATLRHPDLIARFEGVKENLEREIRGSMCTPEQAYAYLENLEISLLLEQEAAVNA
ncbi:hypothetical protein [Rothia nasimurium]|uniref:hypothetical protein n=1 Tax=Rothia nasimurium TaxID=85336 RepID=UPI001F412938|nr:hypothetical protein [Rothia nasimurium]